MTVTRIMKPSSVGPSTWPPTDGASLNRRARAKRATEARLRDAARFLFVNAGYFDTTIRDIAGRMGMSTGAVFNHAPDKPGLWRLVMGGPPPSPQLAEEVALVEAALPDWGYLVRKEPDGRYYASLSTPDYHPLKPEGFLAVGRGDSPASAVRAARIEAERHRGGLIQ